VKIIENFFYVRKTAKINNEKVKREVQSFNQTRCNNEFDVITNDTTFYLASGYLILFSQSSKYTKAYCNTLDVSLVAINVKPAKRIHTAVV
jgi:hypothetical protein